MRFVTEGTAWKRASEAQGLRLGGVWGGMCPRVGHASFWYGKYQTRNLGLFGNQAPMFPFLGKGSAGFWRSTKIKNHLSSKMIKDKVFNEGNIWPGRRAGNSPGPAQITLEGHLASGGETRANGMSLNHPGCRVGICNAIFI